MFVCIMAQRNEVVVEFEDFELSYVKNNKRLAAQSVNVYLKFNGRNFTVSLRSLEKWLVKLKFFAESKQEEVKFQLNEHYYFELFRSEIRLFASTLQDISSGRFASTFQDILQD